MLAELRIVNFALIEQLHLQFQPGFTVLTGETGAGKSLLIDAIALLVGGRAAVDHIRSGEEEAHLAYLAATSGLGIGGGSRVVFDTGGGSSQFTFGDAAAVAEQFSVPVGSVRLTERHELDRAVSERALRDVLDEIAAELGRLDDRRAPDVLVGMGGTLTNLAAVEHGLAVYDPDVVHGSRLDRAEIDRQIELYRTRSADERRALAGLQPNRADVILAGACIVRTTLALLGADSLTVSDRGLRHGLLAERFARP